MSRVTSKLQVTIPRRIARAHSIEPGDDIEFESAGEVLRIRTGGGGKGRGDVDVSFRLGLFDEATRRQSGRNARWRRDSRAKARGRGWKREDLYDRGIPR